MRSVFPHIIKFLSHHLLGSGSFTSTAVSHDTALMPTASGAGTPAVNTYSDVDVEAMLLLLRKFHATTWILPSASRCLQRSVIRATAQVESRQRWPRFFLTAN